MNVAMEKMQSLNFLDARTKDFPDLDPYSFSYKIAGSNFGLDIPVVGDLEVDEGTMSLVIPAADGNDRDGVGDLLEITGINTSRHIRNPLALFDHGKEISRPIGRCRQDPKDVSSYTFKIDAVNKKAGARCFFYQGLNDCATTGECPTGTHSHFCLELFDMASRGLIGSGSVGYQVISGSPLQPDYVSGLPQGLHLQKILLLEVSLVVLPANARTVGKNDKSYDRLQATLDYIYKALSGGLINGERPSPLFIKSFSHRVPERPLSIGFDQKGLKVPNYRQAENPEESCQTCQAFQPMGGQFGSCRMFGVGVTPESTCDRWIGENGEQMGEKSLSSKHGPSCKCAKCQMQYHQKGKKSCCDACAAGHKCSCESEMETKAVSREGDQMPWQDYQNRRRFLGTAAGAVGGGLLAGKEAREGAREAEASGPKQKQPKPPKPSLGKAMVGLMGTKAEPEQPKPKPQQQTASPPASNPAATPAQSGISAPSVEAQPQSQPRAPGQPPPINRLPTGEPFVEGRPWNLPSLESGESIPDIDDVSEGEFTEEGQKKPGFFRRLGREARDWAKPAALATAGFGAIAGGAVEVGHLINQSHQSERLAQRLEAEGKEELAQKARLLAKQQHDAAAALQEQEEERAAAEPGGESFEAPKEEPTGGGGDFGTSEPGVQNVGTEVPTPMNQGPTSGMQSPTAEKVATDQRGGGTNAPKPQEDPRAVARRLGLSPGELPHFEDWKARKAAHLEGLSEEQKAKLYRANRPKHSIDRYPSGKERPMQRIGQRALPEFAWNTKSLKDLRRKWRKGDFHRSRRGSPGSIHMNLSVRDLESLREDGKSKGVEIKWVSDDGKGNVRVKLSGMDPVLEDLAKTYAKYLDRGVKMKNLPNSARKGTVGTNSIGTIPQQDDVGLNPIPGEKKRPKQQEVVHSRERQTLASGHAEQNEDGMGAYFQGEMPPAVPVSTATGREKKGLQTRVKAADNNTTRPYLPTDGQGQGPRGEQMPGQEFSQNADRGNVDTFQDTIQTKGPDEDEGGAEKYGAQLVRRFHADAAGLLHEYDDILGLNEDPEIQQMASEVLQWLSGQLDKYEDLFSQKFGDLSPLEGAMEGEEDEELEGGQAESKETEGKPATGRLDEEPTPDEALHGMQRQESGKALTIQDMKRLYFQRVKSLRAQYKGGYGQTESSNRKQIPAPPNHATGPAPNYGGGAGGGGAAGKVNKPKQQYGGGTVPMTKQPQKPKRSFYGGAGGGPADNPANAEQDYHGGVDGGYQHNPSKPTQHFGGGTGGGYANQRKGLEQELLSLRKHLMVLGNRSDRQAKNMRVFLIKKIKKTELLKDTLLQNKEDKKHRPGSNEEKRGGMDLETGKGKDKIKGEVTGGKALRNGKVKMGGMDMPGMPGMDMGGEGGGDEGGMEM